MGRRLSLAACVLAAMAVTVAPTNSAPAPPATPAPLKPLTAKEVKQVRKTTTGCRTLYTRAQQRRYVTRHYRASVQITRRVHRTSYTRTRCQHTIRSERIARAKWRKERRERNRILARGNAGLGFLMARERGWGGQQFACLDELWGKRESGWNHRAKNPHSSAYGIPQSLPGSKMARFGRDWATNPRVQIAWGLWYIRGRFGSPCNALAHSRAKGWY